MGFEIGLFVGKLMKKGDRVRAEKILLNCILELKNKHEIKHPLETIIVALQKVSPLVEIKSKKVGGTMYRIPKEINESRALAIGIGWLLESARDNKNLKLSESIVKELLLAYSGQGKAVERVREVHKFAQKNRGLVKFL